MKPSLWNPYPFDIQMNLVRLSHVIRVELLIRPDERVDESRLPLILGCERHFLVEQGVVLQESRLELPYMVLVVRLGLRIFTAVLSCRSLARGRHRRTRSNQLTISL